MDGIMQRQYPVSAKTGISYDDYERMGVDRHRLRDTKTVPLFAQNDSMFRRVILLKVWRYCNRGPIPENIKLAELDEQATRKALNPEFGFETKAPAHQEKFERHAEIIRRCGGYASFCSAIAYRAWRLRWDSTHIAEEMKLTPEHVRQTLSRLVSIADELGFPTFEKQHHSKGVPKNFRGVSRDGRVYGRPKEKKQPREPHKSPVYIVGPTLAIAIAMRAEGKPLKEISAACGASVCLISTTLCRMGLRAQRKLFQFDAAAFNAARAEGKEVAEIAKAWGISSGTLQAAIYHHRQRHGFDSVPKRVSMKRGTIVDVEKATALRQQGKTFKEIGALLGVHKATVHAAMLQAGAYNPGRKSKVDVEQAKALRAQGKTCREIGQVLGVHQTTVGAVLLRAGMMIPMRRKKVDIEQAKAMRAEGKTLKEIGGVFGVTGPAVQHALRRHHND